MSIVGPTGFTVWPIVGDVETGALKDYARRAENSLRVSVTVGASGNSLITETGHPIKHTPADSTPILVNWHLPNLLELSRLNYKGPVLESYKRCANISLESWEASGRVRNQRPVP